MKSEAELKALAQQRCETSDSTDAFSMKMEEIRQAKWPLDVLYLSHSDARDFIEWQKKQQKNQRKGKVK